MPVNTVPGCQITDELPVDFQVIRRQALQITKRRQAAAEIVQCKSYAEFTHRFEKRNCVTQIGDCCGFRDFEAKFVMVERDRLDQINVSVLAAL